MGFRNQQKKLEITYAYPEDHCALVKSLMVSIDHSVTCYVNANEPLLKVIYGRFYTQISR